MHRCDDEWGWGTTKYFGVCVVLLGVYGPRSLIAGNVPTHMGGHHVVDELVKFPCRLRMRPGCTKFWTSI